MKCPMCKNLRPVEKSTDPDFVVERALSYKELLKSKGSGCQICWAVYRGIEILTEDCREGQPLDDLLRASFRVPGHLGYLIHLRTRLRRPVEVRADFVVYRPEDLAGGVATKKRCKFAMRLCFELFTEENPAKPLPVKWFGPARKVTTRPQPERRALLLREWIESCDKAHKTCGKWGDGSSGPTRVLDLGGKPRSKITLVPYERGMGDYAILSHPWNKGQRNPNNLVPTLTTNNYNSMLKGIRWSDLPAAWKDAVLVTSEQSIRYLWINALCVVQDSDVDFALHVEQLHDIYTGACLNISAARISDVGASFLGPRRLSLPNERRDYPTSKKNSSNTQADEMKCHEIILSHNKQRFTVYMRRMLCSSHTWFGPTICESCHNPTTHKSLRRDLRGQDMAMNPIEQSAWAFPQRLMSRRTVHFHASEMVFECQTCTMCECCLFPTALNPADSYVDVDAHLLRAASKRADTDRLEFIWNAVTSKYPYLYMPDNRHRIYALSGILPMLEKLGGTCSGGIMGDSHTGFVKNLLWMVAKPENWQRHGSYKFYARSLPTWSWASMQTKGADSILNFSHARQWSAFHVDSDFIVDQIGSFHPHQGSEFTERSAKCWKLDVRGRLMLGKISPKFLKHPSHSWAPANKPLLDFYVPPSPYDQQPNPTHLTPTTTGPTSGPALNPTFQPGSPIPPGGRDPVQFEPDLWDEPGGVSRRSVFYTAVSLMHQHLTQSYYHIPSRASFLWDCDEWADRYRGSMVPQLAYFLRLGGVCNPRHGGNGTMVSAPPLWATDPPAGHECDMDVGLVLVRAAAFRLDARSEEDPASSDGGPRLERVGLFSVPHSRGYFDNVQVQNVTLV